MTEIPYGDPDAMRAFAFAIRNVADRVGNVASSTYTSAFSFEWDGFAAVRFRGNLQEATTGAKAIVTTLQSLADYLVQQAGILERAQEDARRQIEAERLAHHREPSP